MNKDIEVRADFIREECGKRGVKLMMDEWHDPVSFISLTNERGDMASVSTKGAVFEKVSYVPQWTPEIENWARQEGFSEERIKAQNLIQNVSLKEAVELLS